MKYILLLILSFSSLGFTANAAVNTTFDRLDVIRESISKIGLVSAAENTLLTDYYVKPAFFLLNTLYTRYEYEQLRTSLINRVSLRNSAMPCWVNNTAGCHFENIFGFQMWVKILDRECKKKGLFSGVLNVENINNFLKNTCLK
jgi:hypothetical protein